MSEAVLKNLQDNAVYKSVLLMIQVNSGLAMGTWSSYQCAEYLASDEHSANKSYLFGIISTWGNSSGHAAPFWYLNEIEKNANLIYSYINWDVVNAFLKKCAVVYDQRIESEKTFFREKYPYLYRAIEGIKQLMLESELLSNGKQKEPENLTDDFVKNSATPGPSAPQIKDITAQKKRLSRIDSDLLLLAKHELKNGSGVFKFKKRMREGYALYNEQSKPTAENTYFINDALRSIYVLKSEDCNTLHYSVLAENNKSLIPKTITFSALERYFGKYQKNQHLSCT